MSREAVNTTDDYAVLSRLPLERKILVAQTRIIEALKYCKDNGFKPVISFSGGKDSLVMHHLIMQVDDTVESIFFDTGMEYPQIRKFAGGGYVNQENFIRPAMHFGEIVKQYGWVFPSKDLALHVAHPNCKTANVNKRTVDCLMQSPFKFSAKCCAVLKKDVANKYCKEHRAITFVGIKAAESATRFFTWQRNGCNMTKGKTKSFRPLMIFNDNDVLTYIKKYNLTLCEIYGDIIETGKAQKRGIIKPVGETKIAKSFKPSPSCKNYYEWTEQETVPVYKTTGLPRTGCCCCPCSDYTEMQLDKQFAPRMYEYVMSLGLRDIIDYCKANDICRNKWS